MKEIAIEYKKLKQMARSLPVAEIMPSQFKKLIGRKDIDYSKLKHGQLVGIFRGHQLIIRRLYFRYYDRKYSANHKSKGGREMLIANFPLGKGKII